MVIELLSINLIIQWVLCSGEPSFPGPGPAMLNQFMQKAWKVPNKGEFKFHQWQKEGSGKCHLRMTLGRIDRGRHACIDVKRMRVSQVSPEGQRLLESVGWKREEDLKQPVLLRNLNIFLCGWSVEYRVVLLSRCKEWRKDKGHLKSLFLVLAFTKMLWGDE